MATFFSGKTVQKRSAVNKRKILIFNYNLIVLINLITIMERIIQSRIMALEECVKIIINMNKAAKEQYRIVEQAYEKVRIAIK